MNGYIICLHSGITFSNTKELRTHATSWWISKVSFEAKTKYKGPQIVQLHLYELLGEGKPHDVKYTVAAWGQRWRRHDGKGLIQEFFKDDGNVLWYFTGMHIC